MEQSKSAAVRCSHTLRRAVCDREETCLRGKVAGFGEDGSSRSIVVVVVVVVLVVVVVVVAAAAPTMVSLVYTTSQ